MFAPCDLTKAEDADSDSTSSSDDDSDDSNDHEQRRRREAGDRHPPLATVAVRGGLLKLFVGHGESDEMYAVAECDRHGHKCHKQRTMRARKGGARTAHGRPIGYLLAWLRKGLDHCVLDAKQHKRRMRVTRAERRAARTDAKTNPALRVFLDSERDVRSDEEDSEPERQP